MKLKRKTLLLLLPLAILPLMIYMVFCYTYIIGHSQKALITQLQSALDQAELDVKSRFQAAATIVEMASISAPMVNLLATDSSEDNAATHAYFKSIVGLSDDMFSMALVDESGAVIEQYVGSGHEPLDYAIYANLANEADSVLYTRVEHQDHAKSSRYVLTRKIKAQRLQDGSPSRWVRGYLILGVHLDNLAQISQNNKNNSIGDLLFTDAEGTHYFGDLYQPNLTDEAALKHTIGDRQRSVRKYTINEKDYEAGFIRLHNNLYVVAITEENARALLASNLLQYSYWFLLFVAAISALICLHFTSTTLIGPLNTLKGRIKDARDGKIRRESSEVAIIDSNSDEIDELSAAFAEMTNSLVESQDAVNKLAYYDPLTNLPNKITFEKALQIGIQHSQISHRALAVLVIDLDNFKLVNDVHGHTAGDDVLKEVAGRLRNCLKHIDLTNALNDVSPLYAQDMIIRNGGDEFSILLTDLFQAYQASLIAQRIVDELSTPFSINQSKIKLGASVGISLYPVDGVEPEELIKNADLAMFEAKKKGKNNFQFFTQALNASASKRLQTENDLRIAIEEGQLELYYQPIIYMPTGKITKLEVLLRWNHPERGVILPAQFIPVAEESGQIIQLGNLVFDVACEQLAIWHAAGFSDISLSINLSPKQLAKGNPVEAIQQATKKHGILCQFLEVEVKEDLLTKDQAASSEVLNAIREAGVSISLDDFGSGFASLSFLKKFPINTIKIDRSLVREMTEDNRSLMIIQTTTRLAKDLQLAVVLEGIEYESQLQLVKKCNADYAQGYFFSTPLPAAEIDLSKVWHLPQ